MVLVLRNEKMGEIEVYGLIKNQRLCLVDEDRFLLHFECKLKTRFTCSLGGLCCLQTHAHVCI